MHGPAAEALSCALLAVLLAAAITRPKWLPEAAAAGLAAVAVIASGALPWQQARAEACRCCRCWRSSARSWW